MPVAAASLGWPLEAKKKLKTGNKEIIILCFYLFLFLFCYIWYPTLLWSNDCLSIRDTERIKTHKTPVLPHTKKQQ